MAKKALLIFISAIMLAGCGYTMILTGKDAAFTIYPAQVSNYSKDLSATSQFRDSVKLYLTTINALAEKDEADYSGEFILQKVESSGSSTSSASTSVYVRITVSVKIYGKEGRIFEKTFTASENYDNTNSQSATRNNKDLAVNKAIERTMMDFRNAFEQRK